MITAQVIDNVLNGIITSEGGFVDDPTDHGGATNYGITLNTLRAQDGYEGATIDTIKSLDVEVAKLIYTQTYVKPYVILSNPIVFKFIVNSAVQHGLSGANRIIQRALGLRIDGVLGKETQGKLLCNEASPTQFLSNLVAARLRYYTAIVDRDPAQSKFMKGWANRVAQDLS
jgi:lysozyme family protein